MKLKPYFCEHRNEWGKMYSCRKEKENETQTKVGTQTMEISSPKYRTPTEGPL